MRLADLPEDRLKPSVSSVPGSLYLHSHCCPSGTVFSLVRLYLVISSESSTFNPSRELISVFKNCEGRDALL